MLDRHYAPRAALLVVDGNDVRRAIAHAHHAGRTVGAILRTPGLATTSANHVIELPDDPAGYASGLYAALHRLDDAGVDVIVAERPANGPEWHAVRDRLARAAHR